MYFVQLLLHRCMYSTRIFFEHTWMKYIIGQVIEDMKIQTNVPALGMEEVKHLSYFY